MAVPTGIEPAISCVTGRHVNRYTTGPLLKRKLLSQIKPLDYVYGSQQGSRPCQLFADQPNADDPYGIRTRVTAVKGRCLNRLTKGPLE